MKLTLTILFALVWMALALLESGATAAAIHQRRHSRSRGHVARLQDTVDRLLLRQETDHILLNNLQKAVLELQQQKKNEPFKDVEEGSTPFFPSSGMLASVEAEGLALSALGERMKEVRGTLTEALEAEERQDDMALLRQELAYLRLYRSGDSIWEVERSPYHLLGVSAHLISMLTENPASVQLNQKRALREQCLDYVAEYITELGASADPSAGVIYAHLKTCQAQLERFL